MRVLVLEDCAADAQLGFLDNLDPPPDLVPADYSIPAIIRLFRHEALHGS